MNCGRSSSVEWKLPKLQRRVRFPSPAPFSAWPRAGRFCYAPLRARVRMRMRIGYRHADRLISYPDAHNLSVKQQPIRAHRQGCNDDAGVKGADGQRQGQAGVLVGSGRARPGCWWAATGPGRAIHSDLAPLVRRAPEESVGLAAVPVGGGGAWPGFETTRRAKLAARTARGRAAAHGHNQQPGPTAHHAAPGTPAAPQAATQRKHAAARKGRRAFTQLVHTLDTVERPSIQCSRAATTSATWTALRAAPLRRLSPETTRMRPRLPSTA